MARKDWKPPAKEKGQRRIEKAAIYVGPMQSRRTVSAQGIEAQERRSPKRAQIVNGDGRPLMGRQTFSSLRLAFRALSRPVKQRSPPSYEEWLSSLEPGSNDTLEKYYSLFPPNNNLRTLYEIGEQRDANNTGASKKSDGSTTGDEDEYQMDTLIMASDPDLRHAISMRPHPFHLHEHETTQSQSSAAPESPANVSTFHIKAHAHGAHSTSYEAPDEDSEPVARHAAFDHDVEARSQSYTSQDDPFGLSRQRKSASEIDSMTANTSRRRRKVKQFYEEQNENIERLLKSVEDHRRAAKEEEGDTKLKFRIAVYGSFAANIILAGLQTFAAAKSGSLALFTTMADALFDPLSNVGLEVTNRMSKRVNARRYPSGKARVETVGNIIFCWIMTAGTYSIC
ncbi:hypothetical protein FKW77_001949 [Venturia effusa]|uniref:Cation efflux protein transmembrane domain-containing protein n=1 Tax=Venturia effusa TaxID=50376 RepID=A0A517LPN2_9PEZI|nr:hypothetical protein FKW77_001949 [Venturia effusa]